MSVSRVYRLLRVVTLLQGTKGYTASELALELDVSRRTVFRDLNMLEMARIPYYFDDDSGAYRIDKHFFLPPINLTLPEALAMLVLTGRLRGASGLPLLSHGARAAVKMESVLPDSIRRHLGSVIDQVHVSLGPLSRHEGLEGIFDELSAAAAEHRVCKLVYLSFAERKQMTFLVHPLRQMFLARAWYLLAYSPANGDLRTFKLARIRKLTVSDRTFTPPPTAQVDAHFGQAWSMIPEGKLYDVHLRFDRKVAGNVAEVQWHPSQQVQWNDDGSMDFRVRVDGLGEISWWILGYGATAEVISPPALRKMIVDAAEKLLARYHAGGRE